MQTLIIEVSGGVVQEVYTDASDLHVMLVDWDKGESPGDDYAGGDLRPARLSDMPSETVSAVLSLSAPAKSS